MDDFELYEDGDQVKITNFAEYFDGERVGEEEPEPDPITDLPRTESSHPDLERRA